MGVAWMSSHICEERDVVLVLKQHGSQKSKHYDRRIKNIALGVFMCNKFLICESELIRAI